MKISEITTDVIKEHCGITDDDETNLLDVYKAAAIAQIKSATGIPDNELDNHEDLTVACLCMIDGMYNERSVTVNVSTRNPIVKQILDLHPRNLVS